MSSRTFDMNFRPDYNPRALFGELAEGRSCGECAVCCTSLEVDTPELKKPAGETCEHCTGSGCGIYETRYPVCRTWFCLWRFVGEMPDEARPDRCGLLFGLAHPDEPPHPFAKTYIRAMAFKDDTAFETELAQDLIEMFSQGDLPVWISTFDSDLFLVHPEAEIVDVVLGNARPKTRQQKKDAKAWEAGVRQRL